MEQKEEKAKVCGHSSIDLTADDGGAQSNNPDDDFDISW